MRASNGVNFHLEAFAIVAGTIQDNGTLYLICPHWHNLNETMDEDALRWNDNKLIATPHFYHYFKKCVHEFHFEVTAEFSYPTSDQNPVGFHQFTPQQQNIFENLPLDSADIHLIIAPRGRGKSTLAGKLAKQIVQHSPVLITARSQTALPSFWRINQSEHIQFLSPDVLIKQIEEQTYNAQSWLFIDEAASLPLPLLVRFCEVFHKVVLTTTTHNYEGTGRGFSLKLLPLLSRSVKQWQLTQPLRWQENDPLEHFVDRLLLLDDEIHHTHQKNITKTDFYRLLAAAHYKTTPTDLRRLFDGENQILFPYSENGQLIGGIWAINEGGLDNELSQAIWRGERRPQGNLVAQYLCYQGNLPEAPQLYSIRISRIAVEPHFQNQGIGKRLISDFILQISKQKQPLVDFISVSFGQTEALTYFWQQCSFELVQITPNKEASSGYYSAMMLYPLTEKGKQFVKKAQMQFSRNQALLHLNK
ncbi:acetyltransferase [[Actinobacillus] rossii]|uniref:Acetyltransferase n=1 Tax=[Actinobacillus] rossii TaxID=123820 RepID=A0A380TL87_9PAST|nr:acetyltransferase [[Actinobacillus] rossii]